MAKPRPSPPQPDKKNQQLKEVTWYKKNIIGFRDDHIKDSSGYRKLRVLFEKNSFDILNFQWIIYHWKSYAILHHSSISNIHLSYVYNIPFTLRIIKWYISGKMSKLIHVKPNQTIFFVLGFSLYNHFNVEILTLNNHLSILEIKRRTLLSRCSHSYSRIWIFCIAM
jgi:hypothetical protein